MHLSRLASIAAIAVILLATACNKDKNAPAGNSNAPGPLKYKASMTPAASGDYDGTKGIAADSGFGNTDIILAKDCPSFSCADVSGSSLKTDKLKTACPKGRFLVIEHKGPVKAGTKATMDSVVQAESTGGAMGLMIGDAKTKEVEYLSAGPPVTAKLTLKADDAFEGVVALTVCPK